MQHNSQPSRLIIASLLQPILYGIRGFANAIFHDTARPSPPVATNRAREKLVAAIVKLTSEEIMIVSLNKNYLHNILVLALY
jgi:hypothetical protein